MSDEDLAKFLGIIDRLLTDLAAAREVIEIIAGKRQCIDNLMSHTEIALAFLERTKEQSP